MKITGDIIMVELSLFTTEKHGYDHTTMKFSCIVDGNEVNINGPLKNNAKEFFRIQNAFERGETIRSINIKK